MHIIHIRDTCTCARHALHARTRIAYSSIAYAQSILRCMAVKMSGLCGIAFWFGMHNIAVICIKYAVARYADQNPSRFYAEPYSSMQPFFSPSHDALASPRSMYVFSLKNTGLSTAA